MLKLIGFQDSFALVFEFDLEYPSEIRFWLSHLARPSKSKVCLALKDGIDENFLTVSLNP